MSVPNEYLMTNGCLKFTCRTFEQANCWQLSPTANVVPQLSVTKSVTLRRALHLIDPGLPCPVHNLAAILLFHMCGPTHNEIPEHQNKLPLEKQQLEPKIMCLFPLDLPFLQLCFRVCMGVERSQKMKPPRLQFDSKNQEFETRPNDPRTSGPYGPGTFWILWGFERFVTIKTDLITLKTYLQFLKIEHFIGYDYIRNLNFKGYIFTVVRAIMMNVFWRPRKFKANRGVRIKMSFGYILSEYTAKNNVHSTSFVTLEVRE